MIEKLTCYSVALLSLCGGIGTIYIFTGLFPEQGHYFLIRLILYAIVQLGIGLWTICVIFYLIKCAREM